jgi:Domain of unknown function (DUF305)
VNVRIHLTDLNTAKFRWTLAAVLLAAAGVLTGPHLIPTPRSSAAPYRPSAPPARNALELQFLQENAIAMARMMRAMAPSATGDADRDFVAQMIPHHQGAIDMAMAILRAGRNQHLKRLAQEIIVTQRDEIAAMCLAIGAAAGSPAGVPTKPEGGTALDEQSDSQQAKLAACTQE